MHLYTHVRPSMLGQSGISEYFDGMIEHDGHVGQLLKALDDLNIANDTVVVYTTDNGPHMNSWPDGGYTPFRNEKNSNWEGAFRVPAFVRWPGRIRPGSVSNEIVSALDWFPTLLAAAGDTGVKERLLQGWQTGGRTYKVHLDGYNQMDLITGKGPSARHEIFYFTEGTLSAVRIDDFKYRFTDQPGGWLGATVKVDWPILTNLRLDPFERTGLPNGDKGSLAFYNWFAYEFWRFQFVQQEVGKLAQTAIEFPPMQKGASFNLEAVKEQVQKAMESHVGK
jgi:arylsulfatase